MGSTLNLKPLWEFEIWGSESRLQPGWLIGVRWAAVIVKLAKGPFKGGNIDSFGSLV